MTSLPSFANQLIEECESTNNLARELGESGAPSMTWVAAKRQTQGRGRLGREWISVSGNLLISIVVRPKEMGRWSWLPLATALGAVRALTEIAGSRRLEIKWPNDLWLDGAKLGGILCEGVAGANPFVIVGIGINCLEAPQVSNQRTACLGVAPEQIRARLLAELGRVYAQLDQQGSEGLASEYLKVTALPEGAPITWSGLTGTVVGLGQSGELRVKNSEGIEVSIFADDVLTIPRTDEEWRARLTLEQYQVLRRKGTERPFTGIYWDHRENGQYACAGCGQILFTSDTKFDAGCGWPSFWESIDPKRVKRIEDRSHGMVRVEVVCSRCEGHLGHVFNDGPHPTGERFCINSASIQFKDKLNRS